MLAAHAERDRVLDLEPVADVGDRAAPPRRPPPPSTASEALRRYVVALCEATRRIPGSSSAPAPARRCCCSAPPRRCAALEGRDHALPDDVQALAPSVLEHRLLLAPGATEEDRRDGRRRRAGAGSGALRRDDDRGALDARPRGGVRARRRRLRLAVLVRSRGRARRARRRVANLGRAGGATRAARAAARPLDDRRGRAVSARSPDPLGAPAAARRAGRPSAGRSPAAGRDAPRGGVPASSCAPRGAGAGASSPPPCCSATRWGCTRPRFEASTAERVLVLPRIEPVVRCEARGGPGDGALDGSDGLVGAGLDTRAIDFEIDGLRPYRKGSPASRIHWPTVARSGEMVEHRLVAGADASPLVVLDRCNPADQRRARLRGSRRGLDLRSPGAGRRVHAAGLRRAPARWRSTRSSGRGPRSTPTWQWSRPAAPRPRFSACRRPRRSSG